MFTQKIFGSSLRGCGVYHCRVLVHRFDFVCKSSRDCGTGVHKHLRGDSTIGCPFILGWSNSGRCDSNVAAPMARPADFGPPSRVKRPPRCSARSDANVGLTTITSRRHPDWRRRSPVFKWTRALEQGDRVRLVASGLRTTYFATAIARARNTNLTKDDDERQSLHRLSYSRVVEVCRSPPSGAAGSVP